MHFNLAMKCDGTKGRLTHIENPSVEEFGGKFPDIGLKETSLQVLIKKVSSIDTYFLMVAEGKKGNQKFKL